MHVPLPDLDLDQERPGGILPPVGWPSRDGTIQVEGLVTAYATELAPVLKGVSFTVAPREKIGIVGRTGQFSAVAALVRAVLIYNCVLSI